MNELIDIFSDDFTREFKKNVAEMEEELIIWLNDKYHEITKAKSIFNPSIKNLIIDYCKLSDEQAIKMIYKYVRDTNGVGILKGFANYFKYDKNKLKSCVIVYSVVCYYLFDLELPDKYKEMKIIVGGKVQCIQLNCFIRIKNTKGKLLIDNCDELLQVIKSRK